MADNTLTLELEGDVSLPELTESLMHLNRLVSELAHEVADDVSIQWLVEDLQAGSALTTFVGIADHDEPVLQVIRAYETVGRALQQNEPIPFSPAVAREATAISKIVGNKITAVRFETAEKEFIIYSEFRPEKHSAFKPRVSYGSVKGRVQTLSSRGNLKFTLYDSIFDKPIACYLQDGQEEKMKDIWGKVVSLTGKVTREPENGRPVRVRDIATIDLIPTLQLGGFRIAKGIFGWQEGDEPAEVTIRRLRDDEN